MRKGCARISWKKDKRKTYHRKRKNRSYKLAVEKTHPRRKKPVFIIVSERENLIRMDYLMRELQINTAFGKTK